MRSWFLSIGLALISITIPYGTHALGQSDASPIGSLCASDNERSTIAISEVNADVERRLSEESARQVYVCAEHPAPEVARGVLNVGWGRRYVTELVYTTTSDSEESGYRGGFARIYEEVRPPVGGWEFDSPSGDLWNLVPVYDSPNAAILKLFSTVLTTYSEADISVTVGTVYDN